METYFHYLKAICAGLKNSMKLLSSKNLSKIAEYIKEGSVIALPSATSYGLSCSAVNLEAVNKIFKIKNREKQKPLLVVVASIEEAKKYLVWNEMLEKISNKYWPGPLTVISKAKKSKLVYGVVSEQKTLALRVTSHPVLKKILSFLDYPIVSTSANVSEQEDLYDSSNIIKIYEKRENKPDYVLDFGKLEKNKPTTLISVVNDEIQILRQGEILI